jgi:hypothetical protein
MPEGPTYTPDRLEDGNVAEYSADGFSAYQLLVARWSCLVEERGHLCVGLAVIALSIKDRRKAGGKSQGCKDATE